MHEFPHIHTLNHTSQRMPVCVHTWLNKNEPIFLCWHLCVYKCVSKSLYVFPHKMFKDFRTARDKDRNTLRNSPTWKLTFSKGKAWSSQLMKACRISETANTISIQHKTTQSANCMFGAGSGLVKWSELRIGISATRVQSSAGTASLHLDAYPSVRFETDISLYKTHLIFICDFSMPPA
jgi:hypothetical protein